MLMFGGSVKVGGSLYIQVINWVDTILNHVDDFAQIWRSLHGIYIDPNGIEINNIGFKFCKVLIIETWMV